MKLAKILLGLIFLLLVGGFVWLAVVDVPVEQKEITKTISNDRFFHAE